MKEEIRFPLLLIFISFCAKSEAKIIELNHKGLDANSLQWPGDQNESFKLTPLYEGQTKDGYWYSTFKFSTPEHIDTHIDAPYHFSQYGWTLDQIPVERLIGPAVVIDVKKKVKTNSIYRLTSGDVTGWVETNGMFPNNSIVLVNTGWSKRYGDRVAYFGQASGTSNLIFPGVSADAVQTLLDYRNTSGIQIVGIGLDTPSIDYGPSKKFSAHQVMMAENLYALENLNNLDLVPTRGAELIVMPLKIIGASGSPCRVLALIDEDREGNSSTRPAFGIAFLVLVPLLLLLREFVSCQSL